MNLSYFSHLRLNRFNFLTVQGIYAERLPRRFIIFFFSNTFCIRFLRKKCQLKFNLQAFNKYVHSNGRYGLKKKF